MTDLTKITGIGKAAADKLKAKGVITAEQLPTTDEELSALGLTAKQVEGVKAFQETLGNESGSDQEGVSSPSESDSAEKPTGESESNVETQTSETDTETNQTSDAPAETPDAQAAKDEKVTADEDKTASAPDTSENENLDPEYKEKLDALSEIEGVQFTFLSGGHKNRTLQWTKGNPSAKFTDGLYVSLGVISVQQISLDEETNIVDFVVIYGQTKSRAQLPLDEYTLFAGEVGKKSDRRLNQHRRLG